MMGRFNDRKVALDRKLIWRRIGLGNLRLGNVAGFRVAYKVARSITSVSKEVEKDNK